MDKSIKSIIGLIKVISFLLILALYIILLIIAGGDVLFLFTLIGLLGLLGWIIVGLEQKRAEIEGTDEKLKKLETNNELEEAASEKRIRKLEDLLDKYKEEVESIPDAGYVYIISNIGSFGKNIFKIGHTTRANPVEDIKDLHTAAVPFKFDLHALIFSKDAHSLETVLHHRFAKQRVNKVNKRGFFKISMDDVKQIVNENEGFAYFVGKIGDEYYKTLVDNIDERLKKIANEEYTFKFSRLELLIAIYEKLTENEQDELEENIEFKKEVEDVTGEEEIRKLEDLLDKYKEEVESILDAGYVYIISNIGSFGKNIFKIGHTTRTNPEKRIKELSAKASVPFKFDIHALIFSKDAHSLETMLHHRFAKQRVNKVNSQKEFFKISINDVKQIVKENKGSAYFVEKAEANEYYKTLKIIVNEKLKKKRDEINNIHGKLKKLENEKDELEILIDIYEELNLSTPQFSPMLTPALIAIYEKLTETPIRLKETRKRSDELAVFEEIKEN